MVKLVRKIKILVLWIQFKIFLSSCLVPEIWSLKCWKLQFCLLWTSRDSSVTIETNLRAQRFSAWSDSFVPSSYPVAVWVPEFFLLGWGGRSIKLTAHLHQVMRFRMRGAISPRFHHQVSPWAIWKYVIYPNHTSDIEKIFWSMTSSGAMFRRSVLLPSSLWFTRWHWSWRQDVLPYCRCNFTGLHGVKPS